MADDPIDRRTQLFQTLTSLGVQPNVALGAMASLAGESSVNFDPNSLGDATIPGGSVGVGQWNGPRRTALLNYAQSQKSSANDFGTQLGYLKQELSNPSLPTYQPGVLNALRNANSTAQGTQIWTGQFERPKVDNSAQRMQLTSQVGSVDSNGNFTPGGGRAPARPVTATPSQAPGPIDPSIIARGGSSPAIPTTPGTTINSTPATAAGVSQAQQTQLAQNVKKMLGLPDDDQDQGQQQIKPQQMPPPPGARNVSTLLGGPSGIGQGQVSPAYAQKMASLTQPMTWGAAPPGQMPGTGYGAQAQPSVYGTSLMSNLGRSLDPMWMNSWGQ